MLVTIKRSEHEWKSPDGQVNIWSFEGVLQGGEVISGKTRSKKIAEAIDQTLDLTTKVSTAGKTYYVQVQREDSPYNASGGSQSPSSGETPSQSIQRFHTLLDRLEAATEKLERQTGSYVLKEDEEPSPETQSALDILGGELVDDL